MKMIIGEYERGFLYRNGKFVRMLEPGAHRVASLLGWTVERVDVTDVPMTDASQLATWGRDAAFASSVATIDVQDGSVALHYVDGRFEDALEAGRYVYWNIFRTHTFRAIDLSSSDAREIPVAILERLPEGICKQVAVEEWQAALLYVDGKFVRRLEAGRHFFWQDGRKVEWVVFDMRTLQMDLPSQEILTADKVALRVNFVCSFRIVDPVRMYAEIRDYWTQVYVAAQLALRELMGRMRFDEVLEHKDGIADRVLETLRSREAELYVAFSGAGMKDVILPGEVRDIMNTVLVAEKRAQANVITRREEVASTRSLLNTAKLMDENATLYKLKELEYLEKICDKVGNISVDNASGLLQQLSRVAGG